MARATLTLSSKNYSSWSLRGWLMRKLAGIEFDEMIVAPDDADARAEILLLSPSILVPCLTYEGVKVWDTLAIGEFLNEIAPESGAAAQGSGEARALPLDLRRDAFRLRVAAPGAADEHQGAFPQLQDLVEGARRHRAHHARSGANVWAPMAGRSCSATSRSPTRCMRRSSAVSAPTTSSSTPGLQAYAERIWELPAMQEWRAAALKPRKRRSRNSKSSSERLSFVRSTLTQANRGCR